MKWNNTLMAFEEDIKNRSFFDWIKAHTSFMKPLHRYEGILKIESEKIMFSGKDVKGEEKFIAKFSINDITDIHYGYDDIFTGWEDRAAPWNKPLKIEYNSNNGEKSIYFFVNFHRKYGVRSSDNQKAYHQIKAMLN